MALSAIAQKVTGDSKNWESIYNDNAEVLADVKFKKGSKVAVGVILTLRDSYPY